MNAHHKIFLKVCDCAKAVTISHSQTHISADNQTQSLADAHDSAQQCAFTLTVCKLYVSNYTLAITYILFAHHYKP